MDDTYYIIITIILAVIIFAGISLQRYYHGPYKKAFGFELSKLKPRHWMVITIVVLLLNELAPKMF